MKKNWLRPDEFIPHHEDAPSVSAISSIYMRFRLNPRGRIWSIMTGPPFTDSRVQHLFGLAELVEFNRHQFVRSESHFTDEGFRQLISHPKLQAFSDRNNPLITDAAAQAASGCPRLRWLHFPNCSISDAGVRGLALSSRILALSLNSTAITDECLPYLCKLTNLRRLNLHDTEISNDAIALLKSKLDRCCVQAA